MGETLRFEIVSDSKEEFNSWRRKVEEKIENVRQASTDNRYCRYRCRLHCVVTSANIFFPTTDVALIRNHILHHYH